MLHLTFARKAGRPLAILCVGAHPDDIEIGCGGTVLALLERHPGSVVDWVVLTGDEQRAAEARRSAGRLLRRAGTRQVRLHDFRDGFLPWEGPGVKEVFEGLKTVEPDVVFTHFRNDLHQDHRVVSELTWNTFRDHVILEYEIPKYDGDLAHPNVYVPLAKRIRKRKVAHLMSAFPSQEKKRWFSRETFDGLMRIRGVECGAPEGFAEAFHGRKLLFAPDPGEGGTGDAGS